MRTVPARVSAMVLALGLLSAAASAVAGQDPASQAPREAVAPHAEGGTGDTVMVVASTLYEAGLLRRLLLGRRYREVWSEPVPVPLLDLHRFGGGLTPVERGGGVQTSSLRFEAPDGREYNFRSADKSYENSMPDWAAGTLLEWLRQDQTSAQHPGAVLVATSLLETVGILHPGPRLVVMPDDPRLGEYREEFAGMLGTIEVHANEGEDDEPLFADSRTVAGADRVLEHLDEEPEHRVDAAAFLAERLMSVYLGDWDRHIDQYRFARYEEDGVYRWVVVPEDRDYAFVYHDGLLMTIARRAVTARLIRFREEYPDHSAMLSNSQELARRLLAGVDRPTWDSVAHALHGRLTDEAIDRAVATLPRPWAERSGAELTRTLKARRDRFLEMAEDLYELMAAHVEVYATEQDEVATVERHPDGRVTVRLVAPGNEGWGDRPYYRRTFHPDETSDVRIRLGEGDDRAVIRGAAMEDILVRVIGGEGDDVLLDSVGAGVALYDAEGDNRIEAIGDTRVDRRPYEPPEEGFSVLPNTARHWGAEGSWLSPAVRWLPDVGLLVGAGPAVTRYGFRHDPFASRHRASVVVSPVAPRGGLLYNGDIRPENSRSRIGLHLEASNVQRVRFHGLGNASPGLAEEDALTWLRRAGARVTYQRPWVGDLSFELGATLRYTDPQLEDGSQLEVLRPFGATDLAEAGLGAALDLDTRDSSHFPRRGLRARLAVDGFLPFDEGWDPFATTTARAAAFVPLPVPAILAVRAGGELLTGTAPFYSAPRLGGRHDLRGFSHNRFIGDALAHGTAELRVPLFPANIVARGTVGVSALGDIGRVWLDGASPGGWHTAAGAALWFHTTPVSLAAEWVRGEKDSFYLRLGMGL